jgi:hypothetical protein
METWTSIPPSAAKKIIKGVKEMEVVRTKALEEIRNWRDEMLVKLLKIIQKNIKNREKKNRKIEK